MISNVNFSDYVALQRLLDNEFGTGMFVVGVDKSQEFRQIYIEYDDSVEPNMLSSALTIAEQQAEICLQKNKKMLHDRITRTAVKTLSRCEAKTVTQTQADEIEEWVNNQNNPCPESVVDLAVAQNLTTAVAANILLGKFQQYQTIASQVATIRQNGKAKILQATNFAQLKVTTTETLNQLSQVETDFLN